MRCEECLAVIEEFFDGELERRQSERVGAHLAACESCSEALDTLASEQEMYLRHDRGLEVGPALWEGVRAGVARLADAEPTPAPASPSGLGSRLLAAFGRLAPRAAFAPALALLLLAAFVGALWLAQRPDSDRQMASAPSAEQTADADPQPSTSPEPGAPPVRLQGGEVASAGPSPDASVAPPSAAAHPGGVSVINAAGASVTTPRRAKSASERAALTPPPDDHLEAIEAEFTRLDARPVTNEPADALIAASSARLLTPEEKEMARHLEQAQRLLRSFQNEAAAGGDAVQIAYERRLSRRLLAENETLRLGAEAAGDRQTRQVLDTLEPFLLDIANLRDDASRDEVRSIKERMEKKEIIAALHVY